MSRYTIKLHPHPADTMNINFARVANLTPRAWLRLHRRMLWRLRHADALKLAADLRLLERQHANLAEGFTARARNATHLEQEVRRLQETVNTLLCAGFQFSTKKIESRDTVRSYSARAIQFDYIPNTEAASRLAMHVIQLERMRCITPYGSDDFYRMKSASDELRHLSRGIAECIHSEVMKALLREGEIEDSRRKEQSEYYRP